MVEVDRYMLAKLSDLTKHVRASYDKYEFADVYSAILSFCSVELSAFYLDFGKDILYIEAADHPARRSIQTAYYEIVKSLLQMLAPILAHTTEEAWSYIPGEKAESIQLSDFPEAVEIADHNELLTKWDHFIKVRDDVLKALEIARSEKVIGKSLESKLTIVAKDDETKQLLQGIDNLHQLLIVSEANVVDSDADAADYEHVAVRVEKHPADRCERCWVASDTVGQDEKHPELCSRCASIVEAHYHA